jgi:hypothetical protein
MTTRSAPATLFAVALIGTPLAATAQEPASAADESLHLMEVVDVNEFRLEVEKTELEFHPGPGEIDGGATEAEERLFTYTPLASFNPYLFDTERVECPVIPDFGSRPVTRAPVTSFHTGFEGNADVKQWELDITDYRGEVFRHLSGKGVPPATLSWDGRGEHDDLLKPGFPYSFVFTIEDSGTNRYQYAGSTFSLPFLAYREGKNQVLEASGHDLFEKRSRQPLAESDRRIDRLLRDILGAPDRAIQVEAWAEDVALAKARAGWLARGLEERLLLAEGQVAYSGFAYKGNPPGRDGLLRVTLLDGKSR